MTLRYMSQDLLDQAGLIHIYIVFSSMSLIWEQKDQLRLQEDKMRELTDALNKQVEENRYNNYDTKLTNLKVLVKYLKNFFKNSLCLFLLNFVLTVYFAQMSALLFCAFQSNNVLEACFDL